MIRITGIMLNIMIVLIGDRVNQFTNKTLVDHPTQPLLDTNSWRLNQGGFDCRLILTVNVVHNEACVSASQSLSLIHSNSLIPSSIGLVFRPKGLGG
ncbi:hypothetical protein scyTo_0018263 [Scyliorhinus torazame]|uniref:Secreted protein n=1 Tax=Scyliorhinus torazame TaxID=75743 RepID=A0A401PRQ8_SCYTO|nr:hypothetical protein [Scyliorhinus torazame]